MLQRRSNLDFDGQTKMPNDHGAVSGTRSFAPVKDRFDLEQLFYAVNGIVLGQHVLDYYSASCDVLHLTKAKTLPRQFVRYGGRRLSWPASRLQIEIVADEPNDILVCLCERAAVHIEKLKVTLGNLATFDSLTELINLRFRQFIAHALAKHTRQNPEAF
jgi:hypothetical protein